MPPKVHLATAIVVLQTIVAATIFHNKSNVVHHLLVIHALMRCVKNLRNNHVHLLLNNQPRGWQHHRVV